MTYRYKEHCGPNNDDNLGYRDKSEIDKWKNRDPIPIYEKFLIKNKKIKRDLIIKIEKNINSKVKTAFEFAEMQNFHQKKSI